MSIKDVFKEESEKNNELSSLVKNESDRSGTFSSIQEHSDEASRATTAIKSNQIVLLVSLTLLRFVGHLSECLPLAFFSRVVKNKGGTVLDAAVSMRIQMISYMISSAVLANYYSKFGTKALLFFGLLGCTFAQMTFGLSDYVLNLPIFITSVSLARLLYGVFKACVTASTFAMVCCEFRNQIGIAFGTLQAGSSAGCLVGTAIGGILYGHFGMVIPVVVSGVVVFIFIVAQYSFFAPYFKNHEATINADISVKKYLSKPLVATTLLVVASVTGISSYANVALTLFFKGKGLSATLAGFALMIWCGSYSGSAVVVGYVTSRNIHSSRFAIGVGSIALSGAMVALTFSQTLALIYVSCFFLGMMDATVITPSFDQLIAPTEDDLSDRSVYGRVSAICQVAVGLGMFILPALVSFIETVTETGPVGFVNAFFGLSILNFSLAICQIISVIALYYLPRSKDLVVKN